VTPPFPGSHQRLALNKKTLAVVKRWQLPIFEDFFSKLEQKKKNDLEQWQKVAKRKYTNFTLLFNFWGFTDDVNSISFLVFVIAAKS
jgi:hypothetical protein